MSFWQRFLILLAAIAIVSFVINLLWNAVFNFSLPPYVSGVIGGLVAVPVWDALKLIKPKQK